MKSVPRSHFRKAIGIAVFHARAVGKGEPLTDDQAERLLTFAETATEVGTNFASRHDKKPVFGCGCPLSAIGYTAEDEITPGMWEFVNVYDTIMCPYLLEAAIAVRAVLTITD